MYSVQNTTPPPAQDPHYKKALTETIRIQLIHLTFQLSLHCGLGVGKLRPESISGFAGYVVSVTTTRLYYSAKQPQTIHKWMDIPVSNKTLFTHKKTTLFTKRQTGQETTFCGPWNNSQDHPKCYRSRMKLSGYMR